MTQLTHYIKFIVLISSIGFFSSCNNASLQKADGEPKGGCYHMVNEKLNEAVNVSYDDKSLSGSGLRTNLAFNENFELNISGKSMGNGQYDVTIQAKSLMQGRENTIETHYETWKFEQKKLLSTEIQHYFREIWISIRLIVMPVQAKTVHYTMVFLASRKVMLP
jgi:hypothetical protein